ncbi:MAG TPA: alpha-1,2-fucosyltransferase [Chthoniobacteraceae bacterium]|jgi:hypothetical protein|nr:alpha-1,2-fucosyltransferase [Chthoniobacteraceae bacterium]
MVIVRLWGGLGNQLFQYAAGFAAANKLKSPLLLDPLRCDLDVNRPYELHHFRITGRPWTNREKRWGERLIRIIRPIDAQTGAAARSFKTVFSPIVSRWFKYVEDQYRGYQPGIFNEIGHIYLAGTWASAKYFEDVASSIRSQFTFLAPPADQNQRMLEKIEACDAICVHVRRGDYVSVLETNERHGVCSLDYYKAAFDYIAARVANPKVFVFSDDPGWVQECLKFPAPTHYVTHNVGRQNYEDLRLMRACRHFIIANSTFSWWGAWLAGGAEKIVVAPKRWGNKLDEMDDPVPDDWVRL